MLTLYCALIPKLGKTLHLFPSYRSISCLLVISKLSESIRLKHLIVVINEQTLIPSHRFGFIHNHSSEEQIHRVVNE